MSWLKRNLYFVVGSIVAVLLLGLAGYYFYSNWTLNTENRTKLSAGYQELDQLVKANPVSEQVNNIEIAKQQAAQLRAVIQREYKYFSPIPPIPKPAGSVVTKEEFASAFRRLVDELAREASSASVELPTKYSFSFQAQRDLTLYAEGSLPPLSAQLGEVKTLCGILFQAKINSLDNLRRERVSNDDLRGPMSDYLGDVSVTNEMAVVTPYEVVFRCFSGELAAVLAGFANAPHGFIVKSINVQPSTASEPSRDVIGGGGEQDYSGYLYRPPVAPAPVMAKGGLPVLLDEKQLKVTLMLNLVKLLPKE